MKGVFFLFCRNLKSLTGREVREWGSTLWTWHDGLPLVQGRDTACSAGLSPRYWSLSRRATPRSGKTSICDASIHFSESWIPVTQLSRSLAGEFMRKERGRIGREGENKEKTASQESKGSFYKGLFWPALTLEKCLWGCFIRTVREKAREVQNIATYIFDSYIWKYIYLSVLFLVTFSCPMYGFQRSFHYLGNGFSK